MERMDAGVRATGDGGLVDGGVKALLKVGEPGLARKEPAVGVVLVGVGVERAGTEGFLTGSGLEDRLERLEEPMPKPKRDGAGGRRVSVSAPLVRSLLGRTGSGLALYQKGEYVFRTYLSLSFFEAAARAPPNTLRTDREVDPRVVGFLTRFAAALGAVGGEALEYEPLERDDIASRLPLDPESDGGLDDCMLVEGMI